jgi:hypothetical protein
MTNTVFYLSSDPTNGISLPIEGILTSDSYLIEGNGITKANLVKVEIGTIVKTIGESAFEDCIALQSVTIPDNSVTSIGLNVFVKSGLKTLYISKNNGLNLKKGEQNVGGKEKVNVVLIGFTKFYINTIDSTPIELSIEGTLTSDSYLIEGNGITKANLVKVEIGTAVNIIGDRAFLSCRLTTVTIPDSVTSIGVGAFHFCGRLTTVTIPDSVETIGGNAFRECEKLNTVTFTGTSQVASIGSAAFYRCKALTTFIIPDSVTSIDGQTFQYCSKLTTVTLPTNDNFKTIGTQTFQGCKALTTLIIPDSVTSIGQRAFANSGIAKLEMSSKSAVKLNLKPNRTQNFFGQTNVYIECPEKIVQPGTISGKNGIDNELNNYNFDKGIEVAVIRLYVPKKRIYEKDRSRILIADFTNIETNGGTEIRDIVWETTTDNGAKWTTIENETKRTYTFTYPVTSTQFRVSCKYTPSTESSSTSLSAISNPTIPLISTQQNDIEQNDIEQNDIEQNVITRNNSFDLSLSDNFNNAEFRKTLTFVTLSTVRDIDFFESKSFLYENMQEVEVGPKIISITGIPFTKDTRYYIRSIEKYLETDTYTPPDWVKDSTKQLYFYLHKNTDELAKTREGDGIEASTLGRSLVLKDIVEWKTKNVNVEIKTNCYKDNKYFPCITSVDKGHGVYAWTDNGGNVDNDEYRREVSYETSDSPNIVDNGLTFPKTLLRGQPTKPEVLYADLWTYGIFPKDFKRILGDITLTYGDTTFTITEFEILGSRWKKDAKNKKNSEGGGGCLPGNSQLILKDGTKKSFHDIEVGDEIQVCSKDMELSYSKVIFLPHLQNNISSEYIKFTTTSNQTIRATTLHLLPVLNKNNTLQNVIAKNITQEDKLYVLNNGKGVPEEIKTIEIIEEEGVYTCLVKEGEYIVVDNIVASPFPGDGLDESYVSKYAFSYTMLRLYAKGFSMLDSVGVLNFTAPLLRSMVFAVANNCHF